MFVTEDKFITYPNRSIVEDMLSRSGAPDSNSFSPWNGAESLMEEQFGGKYKEACISPKEVSECMADFSPEKIRPTDDSAKTRGVYAFEVGSYYTNLEDINEDYIYKYLIEVIIAYKKNNSGFRERQKYETVAYKLYDEETGDYVDASDIIESEIVCSNEDVSEAKRKLPYLLKQLHEGSILYRGSLLSFIIAAEKFLSCSDGANLKPQNIIREGVYKVNRLGEIGERFTTEENTGERLRSLIKWVSGDNKEDMYYKVYMELLRVLKILEIDITKEDATEYTGEYIKKIVCTYIASNEEYIETYGYVDKNILNLLSPERLHDIAKDMVSKESLFIEEDETPNSLIKTIAVNIERLRFKEQGWEYDAYRVLRFIKGFLGITTGDLSLDMFGTYKDIILAPGGNFLIIPVVDIVRGSKGKYAVLTMSAKLVRVQNFDFSVEYVDALEALACMKEGRVCEWRTVSI